MKYSKRCECCGHKITAFTHSVNKSMIGAFDRLVEFYLREGRSANINKELNLTHNQKCNLPKMQYYGLIQNLREGLWIPTRKGLSFYYGEISILMPVATINNKVIEDDHEAWNTHSTPRRTVNIMDIEESHYKQRPEYQEEKGSKSPTLFDIF